MDMQEAANILSDVYMGEITSNQQLDAIERIRVPMEGQLANGYIDALMKLGRKYFEIINVLDEKNKIINRIKNENTA
jgi:hypothetical protein